MFLKLDMQLVPNIDDKQKLKVIHITENKIELKKITKFRWI